MRNRSNDLRKKAARALIEEREPPQTEAEDLNQSDNETVKEFEMSTDGNIQPKVEVLKRKRINDQVAESVRSQATDGNQIDSTSMAKHPTGQHQLESPHVSTHKQDRLNNFRRAKIGGFDSAYK